LLTAVAYFQPVTRVGLGDMLGRKISRDVIAALRSAGLIATGPRSPQPGAPHTYVRKPAFLTLCGLTRLRDLPDLARLEDAGLLGNPRLSSRRAARALQASASPLMRLSVSYCAHRLHLSR
jgi:segregation and condensation protein B